MESIIDRISLNHLLSTPPDYSSRPLPGEQCVQSTPRDTHFDQERCSFTYEEQNMSLTLRGCREEDGIPTFGLCSTVRGEFAPTDRNKIISVAAELRAQIRVKGRSGSLTHILFSKECLLWRKTDSGDPCPSLLPVSISFPSTYQDKYHHQPCRLPPSISINESHRLDIVHSLNITVRKTGCSIIPRKIKEVCISAYLLYRPRVRPPRPSSLSFSEVKSCPEEWQQEIWEMSEVLSNGTGKPLNAQCSIFLPSVRVFASSEPIPFHLSLSSPSSFLDSVARQLSQASACSVNPVHVFLLRKTTVRTKGSKSIHEEVLGVGRMSPNPTITMQPTAQDSVVMSWEGNVCCERAIDYSSFTIGVIEVRDFLVLSLLASPQAGPITGKSIPQRFYHRIPIRLVTHPWIDRS